MNSKYLFILLFLVGCGVKGDPVSPKDSSLPSLLENYPDIETKQKLNEFRKK